MIKQPEDPGCVGAQLDLKAARAGMGEPLLHSLPAGLGACGEEAGWPLARLARKACAQKKRKKLADGPNEWE
ncbi:UNVERIFIED_CONTAM: hypothetical protein K2H54_051442, partial [Gekko kuhli]